MKIRIMNKATFEYNGKTYEVYGRAQHINGNYQPHIYEVENERIPDNQREILRYYLLSKGITEDELRATTTYELVYMAKRYLSSK